MLVLTRRTDESLVIGENIIITILAIEGEKVKIGITAPREITVLRKELWQAIQDQNQAAEKISSDPAPDISNPLRNLAVGDIGNGQLSPGEDKENPDKPRI